MARSVRAAKWALAALCAAALSLEVYTLAFHETSHLGGRGVHQALLREFGDRVPITQTFTMPSDGLEAVSVQLWSERAADVVYERTLSEQQASGAFEPVSAIRTEIRALSGYQKETWSFRTIAKSAGKVYQLELRAADVQSSAPGQSHPAVAVVASLDNVLRPGFLLVGEGDRWGDLELETRASGDTILGRFLLTTRESLPPALRGPAFLWAVFLVYNLSLVALFAHAFRPSTSDQRPVTNDQRPTTNHQRPTTDHQRPTTNDQRPTTTSAIVRNGLVVIGLFASLSVVYAHRQPAGIDLIDEMYTAELKSSRAPHDTFDVVEKSLYSDPIRALTAHADARIAWKLTIPPNGRLHTWVGIDPGAWSAPLGDGVVFRIGVKDGTQYFKLFERHVDPVRVPDDRRWVPVDLDLSTFAGRPVELAFETYSSLPGQPWDSSYDWALWGAPRILFD